MLHDIGIQKIQQEFKNFKANREGSINKSNKNPTFKSNAKEGFSFKPRLIQNWNNSTGQTEVVSPRLVQPKDKKTTSEILLHVQNLFSKKENTNWKIST